jgi:(p)ppGpp synthase/HD superfamily hydrolase
MNDVDLMMHLAFKYHKGQKYGEEDYSYHLNAVASSVRRAFPDDERLVIIAWGHDLLEDTACTEVILRTLFEDDIVDAIVALTKLNYETRDEYLTRLRSNALAAKVKLHDAWCNMAESFRRSDTKRVRKYANTVLALTN